MSRRLPKKVQNLLDKGKESALLAVDIYNKPKTAFRSDGFIVLMCIAWVSLLHAIFEKQKEKYFYKEKNGRYVRINGDKKAWELKKSAKYFFDDNSPIFKNIIFFSELRDKIEHRFLPEIDENIVAECQAFILGFEKILVKNFGENHSLVDSLFIPIQLSEQKRSIPKTKEGEKVLQFINTFRNSLTTDIQNSQDFAFKVFVIPNIGNHRSSSDTAIQFIKFDESNTDEMKKYKKAVVAIRDKKIPVVNLDKYRPKAVLEKIKEKSGIDKNYSWHTNMWKKHEIRLSENNKPEKCKTEFCQWDGASSVYLYTNAWIDFLIKSEVNQSSQ